MKEEALCTVYMTNKSETLKAVQAETNSVAIKHIKISVIQLYDS